MNPKNQLLVTLLTTALTMSAQKPMTAPAGGKQISDELIGIFFEDISSSADGGLYAELVQNGSFEFNTSERDGWGAGTAWRFQRPGHSAGYMVPQYANPLNENNPTYMRLHIERVGHYYDFNGWTGVGIQNDGFDGIRLKKGEKYNFSMFARNVKGDAKKVRVVLATSGGFGRSNALAETEIEIAGNQWQKFEAQLTPTEDASNASLQILALVTGEMDVDMVSLMPEDTYKGHGLRKDLAQALADLHPKFMRFPGGCVVHGGGDGFWDTYRWKTTVGPREQRRGIKNTWGYHQSMGLGYYEYFQFCEDVGMQPLPILPCGVSCQGVNGGWSMRDQAQDWVPMSEMDEWVDEALDLIEWANGAPTTKWGRIRAEAGHPEPFNLKYLGLGNEERISPEFIERFKYIYDRVTKAHPEIVIVGTAGPGSHPGNRDFEAGWKLAEEIGLPILDEHYYEQRQYFLTSRQYDNYPRDRKTKVYLGEYAAKDKKLIDALAEGLYLLHVERNGDVVAMTSYAPLFARKNATNWNPDLIYFDNERPFLTCSYYVQQMFGQSAGQYYYGDCVSIADKTNLQEQSVVLNVKTRKLFVKICNASADTKKASVNLSKFKSMKAAATLTTISGNENDENNYEQQPIEPVTVSVKVGKKFDVELRPFSIVMYTIDL
ncbi:MAG: carbohydrate binding domain-containing protein [Bacteroidaceae bacterium]|nr:carbohydrate binding domain-containing protein [Bacteroidaceae bacterium]